MYNKIEELINLWNNNRFPASWLLTSYSTPGLRIFAEEFLKQIIPKNYLSTTGENLYSHPDISFISLKEKTSGENLKNISTEQIREVSNLFSKSSARLPFKFAIIEDADKMSTQAANCFLKTLEEPPKNCYIFLLSTKAHSLLPTILSRVRILNTSYVNASVYRDNESYSSKAEKSEIKEIGYDNLLNMLDSQELTGYLNCSEVINKNRQKQFDVFSDNMRQILNDLTLACISEEHLNQYSRERVTKIKQFISKNDKAPSYFVKLYEKISKILTETYNQDLDIRQTFIRIHALMTTLKL